MRYMEASVAENAVNRELKEIHHIVEAVKRNREVELSYMKSWEREQEIWKEAQAAGRAEERMNTEREKKRADEERRKAERAEEGNRRLQERLKQYEMEYGKI